MGMRLYIGCLLAFGLGACQSNGQDAPTPAQEPQEQVVLQPVPLQRLLDSLSIAPESLQLRVEKADRRMLVLAQGKVLKEYACVLGENPEGDKRMQGDRRTPEGEFTFRDKYPHRQWHKFVWIDYPNATSRERFAQRKRSGEIPANAQIGGEIGIHGVPMGMDHWIVQGQDWTWGCIAMRNADLDEIYPHIKAGRTVLVIVP